MQQRKPWILREIMTGGDMINPHRNDFIAQLEERADERRFSGGFMGRRYHGSPEAAKGYPERSILC